MYLCREVLNSSFPSIARAFGGKDHSTVIHACTKVRQQMQDGAMEALDQRALLPSPHRGVSKSVGRSCGSANFAPLC